MFNHYQGLAHIAIRTLNVEESISFYEKIGGTLLKKDRLQSAEGEKTLALVSFAGVTLELIQVFTPVADGNIPHFAIYVDDVEAAAAELQSVGVSFMSTEKKVMSLFGGLENWFFTGPAGEQVELLRML